MANRPPIQINVPPLPQPNVSYGSDNGNRHLSGAMNAAVPMMPGLSADRALQFTPFMSSVLPVIDRIPIPEPARAREHGRIAQSAERKVAHSLLQQQQLQPVICKELVSLLNREAPMQIDFRLPPSHRSGTNASTNSLADLGLSPLARSVLSMAKVDYRYLTPPSDTNSETIVVHAPHNSTKSAQVQRLPTPAKSKSPPAVKLETEDLRQDLRVSKPPATGLVINVPPAPAAYRKEEYPTIDKVPKRRKLSHDEDEPLQARSHRQQSDQVLQSFCDLLNDIFEAQDLVDAADGRVTNPKSLQYFDAPFDEGENALAFNSRTLDRLRDEMKKMLALQRLRDAPLDSLRRLQQLCESSVEKGQSLNLRPDIASDDDFVHLQINLARANTSICTAILVIYSMLGNPQKEALLGVDLLRWTANTLVNVFETCIIPTVEARADSKENHIFQNASTLSAPIKQLLNSARRLLEVATSACTLVKSGNVIVNTIEFLAAKLVFVQNAPSEKQSALGLQLYENFRRSAMASLSKIYARFPRERSAILDEVLSSLDKLPSTSRSARTFRTSTGTSIQLITALFIQLVQTTTIHIAERQPHKRQRPSRHADANPSEDAELPADLEANEDEDQEISADEASPIARLDRKMTQLFDPARKSASDIVLYLVARASKTTKTGDSPYRNILDLLIEDLLVILPSFEYPSAEIMLNVLATRMLQIANNEKAASTKNMALESLGIMGSAITKLRAKLVTELERFEPDGSACATDMASFSSTYVQNGSIAATDLVSLSGPLAMVAEELSTISGKSTLQQQSARSYIFAYYAHLLSHTVHTQPDQDMNDAVLYIVGVLSATDTTNQTLGLDLTKGIAELAYLLCIIHLPFCRRLPNIVKALSSSLSSDQAQVKSRSLKSVSAILESDSSLLDRDVSVAEDVFRCASDDSAMVRDSALALIARFIIPRGGRLQEKGLHRLLDCTGDEKIGVQKRAISQLKDIYLQEHRPALRKDILQRFLLRLNDLEETIVSLAEQSLEEILIRPALSQLSKDAHGATATVALEDLATTLMVSATESNIPMLKRFFTLMLSPEKKGMATSRMLCSRLVQALFEKVISTEKVQPPLVVLTALAEADPELVTAQQLSKLQVYLSDLQAGSDPFMFRAAVGICRLVLPHLSESHKELLYEIQNKLMNAISRMGRREELDVIMQCLSTINGVLRNTERLIKLTASIVKQLQLGKLAVEPLKKMLRIAGAIGKHVDLDDYTQLFGQNIPSFNSSSVSACLTATLIPLTSEQRPAEIRAVALESLGSTCQSSPAQFNNVQVRDTFFGMLRRPTDPSDPDDAKLKAVVLKIFDELYAARAASKDQSAKEEAGDGQALKQMGGDSKSRDQDSAIQAITMDVVDLTLKISLSEISDNALPSARTLASISHQGLIHPKQCLGAFVAFGTSANLQIAAVGHKAQKLLHEQHESHCEREYMAAIAQAFKYQLNVVQTPTGAVQTGQAGYKAKLGACFDIISSSNSKYVKKFLSGLVSRLTLDRFASDNTTVEMEHVLFTRFAAQNIAFFDYKKLDELLHVVLQLELAYSKSGGELAQTIESTQLRYPDLVVHEQNPGNPEFGIEPSIYEVRRPDPALGLELKRLGPASACLSLLIEARSHLLRQYGIGRDVRLAMLNNKQAKETTKTPTKVHGITGEKFWSKCNNIITALEDEGACAQLCKDFVGAISVEDDFELDGDETMLSLENGVDGDNSLLSKNNTPSGRKRKRASTPGESPTKKSRGRPRKNQARRSNSISSLDDNLDGDYDA